MIRKLRLKGTDIYLEAICYDSAWGGIKCKYLNGEYKGSYETIKGDCLIEVENY